MGLAQYERFAFVIKRLFTTLPSPQQSWRGDVWGAIERVFVQKWTHCLMNMDEIPVCGGYQSWLKIKCTIVGNTKYKKSFTDFWKSKKFKTPITPLLTFRPTDV